MTGFDFDKAFAKRAREPFMVLSLALDCDGARALVTEALEAALTLVRRGRDGFINEARARWGKA